MDYPGRAGALSLSIALLAAQVQRSALTWRSVQQHSTWRCDVVLLEKVGRLQRQRHQLAQRLALVGKARREPDEQESSSLPGPKAGL